MWRSGERQRRRRRHALITAATDREVQSAVLALVLREHPDLLTFGGLARALFENPYDFLPGYALARAVRDLDLAGLLHSNGLYVMPSRAARHFAHLGVDRCP